MEQMREIFRIYKVNLLSPTSFMVTGQVGSTGPNFEPAFPSLDKDRSEHWKGLTELGG